MSYPAPPSPFLEIKVHDLSISPTLCALCAGYEAGEWRGKALAKHAMRWLPEFCLSYEEVKSLNAGNALDLIEKAAQLVYGTDKYKNRGEFGELFLHIALRQVHNSIPVISKIFFKDSVNNTVKGFDSVHVIEINNTFELWLGEVKFYQDSNSAINDVVEELVEHTKINYLKKEKMLIANKLDKNHPHYEKLSKLLDNNTSLDKIFDCACIPILITYDSKTVKSNNKNTEEYCKNLKKEVHSIRNKLYKKLSQITPPIPIKIHLFLLPLHTKEDFIEQLDSELKRLQ